MSEWVRACVGEWVRGWVSERASEGGSEWVKPPNQWCIGPRSPFMAQAFVQLECNIGHLNSRRWRSKSIGVFQSPTPFQRQKVCAAECHKRNEAPRFPVFRGLQNIVLCCFLRQWANHWWRQCISNFCSPNAVLDQCKTVRIHRWTGRLASWDASVWYEPQQIRDRLFILKTPTKCAPRFVPSVQEICQSSVQPTDGGGPTMDQAKFRKLRSKVCRRPR